jgi:uncharacterized membrane protein YhhN
MLTWPFYLAVFFALLDWVSTWKGWKKRLYIAKPATMVFLILWSLQITGWQGGMLWFGIALILSLAGDIALMLNPRYFMIGGAAFLLAHIAYIIGFNQTSTPFSLNVMLVAVLVGISAANVFKRIRPGIMKVPRGKRFLTGLSLYGISLTLMLLSALLTLFKQDWLLLPAVFAASGAVLFFTSDTMLVYDRFVGRFNHAQSYVHLTYHLGQFGIIIGALLHYLA